MFWFGFWVGVMMVIYAEGAYLAWVENQEFGQSKWRILGFALVWPVHFGWGILKDLWLKIRA